VILKETSKESALKGRVDYEWPLLKGFFLIKRIRAGTPAPTPEIAVSYLVFFVFPKSLQCSYSLLLIFLVFFVPLWVLA